MRKNNSEEKFVGQRLKVIRECLKISRTELASELGVTSQQVKKYEDGRNRIAATTLIRAAQFMHVPLSDFMHDENGDLIESEEQRAIYYWRSLNNPKVRNGFTELMRCVGEVNSIEAEKLGVQDIA